MRVSVSKVSGHVSVSKVSGLETLNIAKKWFIKIFVIHKFFVVFAGKKQTKHVGKMPEIGKNFKSNAMTIYIYIFFFRQNAQISKSRVEVSEFLMKSRSRFESLTRSQSRRLRSRLHHW